MIELLTLWIAVVVFSLIVICIVVTPIFVKNQLKINKETETLVRNGEQRTCIHCKEKVDPRATTCPYCRKNPTM